MAAALAGKRPTSPAESGDGLSAADYRELWHRLRRRPPGVATHASHHCDNRMRRPSYGIVAVFAGCWLVAVGAHVSHGLLARAGGLVPPVGRGRENHPTTPILIGSCGERSARHGLFPPGHRHIPASYDPRAQAPRRRHTRVPPVRQFHATAVAWNCRGVWWVVAVGCAREPRFHGVCSMPWFAIFSFTRRSISFFKKKFPPRSRPETSHPPQTPRPGISSNQKSKNHNS